MKNYAVLIGSSRFEKEPKLTPCVALKMMWMACGTC